MESQWLARERVGGWLHDTLVKVMAGIEKKDADNAAVVSGRTAAVHIQVSTCMCSLQCYNL